AFGDGPLFLALERIENGFMHVVRDFGRGAANKFQQGILQRVHRGEITDQAWASQSGERLEPVAKKNVKKDLREVRGKVGSQWIHGPETTQRRAAASA